MQIIKDSSIQEILTIFGDSDLQHVVEMVESFDFEKQIDKYIIFIVIKLHVIQTIFHEKKNFSDKLLDENRDAYNCILLYKIKYFIN